jgi:hypothetical protein
MIHQRAPRFARIMMPGPGSVDRACAYIFMILAYPDDIPLEGGYQQYRKVRVRMLEAYCLALMAKHRNLEVVVGINVDAPSEMTGREGGSEDLVAVGKQEWTPEFAAEVEKRRLEFNVLENYTGEATRFAVEEYPAPPDDPQAITRQQRRAVERAYAKSMRQRGPRS